MKVSITITVTQPPPLVQQWAQTGVNHLSGFSWWSLSAAPLGILMTSMPVTNEPCLQQEVLFLSTHRLSSESRLRPHPSDGAVSYRATEQTLFTADLVGPSKSLPELVATSRGHHVCGSSQLRPNIRVTVSGVHPSCSYWFQCADDT